MTLRNFESAVPLTPLSHDSGVISNLKLTTVLASILGCESVAEREMFDKKNRVKKSREAVSLKATYTFLFSDLLVFFVSINAGKIGNSGLIIVS